MVLENYQSFAGTRKCFSKWIFVLVFLPKRFFNELSFLCIIFSWMWLWLHFLRLLFNTFTTNWHPLSDSFCVWRNKKINCSILQTDIVRTVILLLCWREMALLSTRPITSYDLSCIEIWKTWWQSLLNISWSGKFYDDCISKTTFYAMFGRCWEESSYHCSVSIVQFKLVD